MSKIGTKRQVPPSDSPRKTKKQDTELMLLTEQRNELKDLVTKIGNVFTSPPPPSPVPFKNTSSRVTVLLNAVELALSDIPEHLHFRCLIGLLQYLEDFHNNNK